MSKSTTNAVTTATQVSSGTSVPPSSSATRPRGSLSIDEVREFGPYSPRVRKQIARMPISANARLLLHVLVTFVNRDSWQCEVGLDRLISDTGMPRSTVKRARTEVIEKRIISISHRASSSGDGHDTNLTTVNAEAFANLAKPEKPSKRESRSTVDSPAQSRGTESASKSEPTSGSKINGSGSTMNLPKHESGSTVDLQQPESGSTVDPKETSDLISGHYLVRDQSEKETMRSDGAMPACTDTKSDPQCGADHQPLVNDEPSDSEASTTVTVQQSDPASGSRVDLPHISGQLRTEPAWFSRIGCAIGDCRQYAGSMDKDALCDVHRRERQKDARDARAQKFRKSILAESNDQYQPSYVRNPLAAS